MRARGPLRTPSASVELHDHGSGLGIGVQWGSGQDRTRMGWQMTREAAEMLRDSLSETLGRHVV